MANEVLQKIVASISVPNGTSAGGSPKYASVRLPGISKTGYSAEAFYAIGTAANPVFASGINQLLAVKTYAVAAN